MSPGGEVLIAIVKNLADLETARQQHWYRIPVTSRKWLGDQWPPKLLGLYQPKVFKNEAFQVRCVAPVLQCSEVSRNELFPSEPKNAISENHYFKLELDELRFLDRPIPSRRLRRISFIPTTFEKLDSAIEINDLYAGSQLEDRLWAILRRYEIEAEREYEERVESKNYFLDFAVFCAQGKIDIETDGDRYHLGRELAQKDNHRNNALTSIGWQILRFTSAEILEQIDACFESISSTINMLGGMQIGKSFRLIHPNAPGSYQLGLFDTTI